MADDPAPRATSGPHGGDPEGSPELDLRPLTLVLLALALVLGVALVVLLQRDDSVPPASPVDRQRAAYAAVSRAATDQVQGFLGIDHENVEEQAAAVLENATGDFAEQYREGLDDLVAATRRQRSAATPSVLEVGVSDLDAQDRAVVLVAANTEVTSRATGGRTRTVPWRLRLVLVREGERWLTEQLELVGRS